MNRPRMFLILFSLLFCLAAFSPSFHFYESAAPRAETICTPWEDLSLYLPATLVAAPLSNEAPGEQTFISSDGQLEVIVRRRPRTRSIEAAYNARVTARWAHPGPVVDLLDKAVTPKGYHLEWLVDRHVLVEAARVVENEWVSIEASGPLVQRAALRQLVDNWRVERAVQLP